MFRFFDFQAVRAMTVGPMFGSNDNDAASLPHDDMKTTELLTLCRSLLVGLLRMRDHQLTGEGSGEGSGEGLVLLAAGEGSSPFHWRVEVVLLAFEFFVRRTSHRALMQYAMNVLTQREQPNLPLRRLATNVLCALSNASRCTPDVVAVGATLLGGSGGSAASATTCTERK